MAYDEGLAQIILDDLLGTPDVISKKMFGGQCFMLRGHMLCGVHQAKDKTTDMAMFRVGSDLYERAFALSGVETLSFTGRPMKGFVETGADVFENDALREKLIQMVLAANASLKPK